MSSRLSSPIIIITGTSIVNSSNSFDLLIFWGVRFPSTRFSSISRQLCFVNVTAVYHFA